jgi:glycosyltransferase involved in cell wall biosynthesis
MRVLYVHSGNLYGGVETLLGTLARERRKCPRLEPHFALCFEGRLAGELRAAGATVHALGGVRVSRPLGVWRARRSLARLLARESFDVLVCQNAWTLAVFGAVAREAGLPLALWVHDAPDGRHWLERWARRTPPDLLVCNSRFTAGAARRLYPAARAEVVYCPVSEAAATEGATREGRAGVRAEFETAAEATVIMQASRMERWKGQARHLEALALVRDVPGWVCWQAGGGQRPREAEYLAGLKAQAARLGIEGRVRFVGERADVPRLLAAADIYCQPNEGAEPFGLAFVEALRAGLPVIAADAGGAREIVDESCGALVPPGDARALSRTLRTLIEDDSLRARLGRGGPARALQLCDPARQLARLAEVFGTLARRRDAA